MDWISVKDRLPEENTPVNIVWTNRNPESYYSNIKDKPFVSTGIYFRGKWFWYSVFCEDCLAEYGKCVSDEMDENIEVLYWMPLPELPKED